MKLWANIFRVVNAKARSANPGEHLHHVTKTLVHIKVIKAGYETIFVLLKVPSSLGSAFKLTTPSIHHVTNECSCSNLKSFKIFLPPTMSPEQFSNLMLLTVYNKWSNGLNLISITHKLSDHKHKRKSVWNIKSEKYVQEHKEMFCLYSGIEKIIY